MVRAWARALAIVMVAFLLGALTPSAETNPPGPARARAAHALCNPVPAVSGQDLSALLAADLSGGGCWELPAGRFYLSRPVEVPPGTVLQGAGMDATQLVARDWPGWAAGEPQGTPMLTTAGACPGTCRTLLRLTVDGNDGEALNVLGADNMVVLAVRIRGGACSGVEINSSDVDIEASVIEENGNPGARVLRSRCPGVEQVPDPGAQAGPGVYLAYADADIQRDCHQQTARGLVTCPYRNVRFAGNEISHNGTFGVDANGFSGDEGGSGPGDYVQFTGNVLTGNGFGGLSLYASSHWNIQGNTITNPAPA